MTNLRVKYCFIFLKKNHIFEFLGLCLLGEKKKKELLWFVTTRFNSYVKLLIYLYN